MSDHWFVREAEGLVATGIAVSPHAADAQHGSAVAALVAEAVEATPSPVPMDIVRLTVDMTHRIPVGVTRVETNVRRSGRRLQMVEATLFVDDQPYTRSEALRMRSGDVIDPADLPPVPDREGPVPFDRARDLGIQPWGGGPFFELIDVVFESWEQSSAVYWVRMFDQLVAGEVMSPVARACAAADISLTGGRLLPGYPCTNADLTINFHRPPVGERFRIESTIRADPRGWGGSTTSLFDLGGRVATVTKSLLYGEKPVD